MTRRFFEGAQLSNAAGDWAKSTDCKIDQDISNSNESATFQLRAEHTNPIESAIHITESSISYISTSLGGSKAQIFQTQLGGDRYRLLDLTPSVRILSFIGTPIISLLTDQSDSESGTDPTGRDFGSSEACNTVSRSSFARLLQSDVCGAQKRWGCHPVINLKSQLLPVHSSLQV